MVRCVCGHPVRSDLVTGIHYFGQCSLCSDLKWRHDQVAAVLRVLLAELKLDVEHAERAVWWSQAPELRPFDVLYRERAIGSIWKGLDVGIADPTRTARLFSQTRQRWFRSGQAANWMAQQKLTDYNGLLSKFGSPRVATSFSPFIIEASGGFGGRAKDLFEHWCELAGNIGVGANYRRDAEDAYDAAFTDPDPATIHEFTHSAMNFSSWWLQRLSFTAVKCIAKAVLGGIGRSAAVLPPGRPIGHRR